MILTPLDAEALPRLRKTIAAIIETGIGELAAATIEYVEVAQLSGPAEDQIPLASLGEYLEWHRKQSAL